jgi:RTX calcium-binding nonapeptide repeat (4 copies)
MALPATTVWTVAAGPITSGGKGNDTYFVDNYHDVIWEWGGEGTDTVVVSADAPYDLPTAVENLVMAGLARIAYCNDLANYIIGSNLDNSLHGEGGNDEIHGEFGDDVLWGGPDNDILHGGPGQDGLIGDEGADSFSYVSTDDATATTTRTPTSFTTSPRRRVIRSISLLSTPTATLPTATPPSISSVPRTFPSMRPAKSAIPTTARILSSCSTPTAMPRA